MIGSVETGWMIGWKRTTVYMYLGDGIGWARLMIRTVLLSD
jgi:hypothetical protein